MCMVGCKEGSDCPSSTTCIDNRCTNPCSVASCGPNARCTVVDQRAQCSCLEGFQPNSNAAVGCIREAIVCLTNSQCPPGMQCDSSFCKPICNNDDNCLPNELCLGSICKDICRTDNDCGPQEICQGVTCTKGCRVNNECPSSSACINNLCQNPCINNRCGVNAKCTPSNHEALCSCENGLTGDPLKICENPPKACARDSSCSAGSKCVNGFCNLICTNTESDCLPNEVCFDGTCSKICNSDDQCPGDSQVCKNRICGPGCSSSSTCKDDEICIQNECQDPCVTQTPSPCGKCATCETTNHETFCSCPSGLGDPLSICHGGNKLKCSSNNNCNSNEKCFSGLCSSKCRSDRGCNCGESCSSNGICIQKCFTSNDCVNGYNCIGGLCTGGCNNNNDCLESEACIDGTCTDPCSLNPCGGTFTCTVSTHKSLCLCPQGTQRINNKCVKTQCTINSDCSSDKQCLDGLCVNPCSLPQTCGLNAQCFVSGHRPQCSCPPGFIGNPTRQCTEDVDECLSSPCGAKSICIDLIGSYKCKCEPGCKGDPYKGCICPDNLIDPCRTKRCGTNALCINDNGVASCACTADHPKGNPDIQCHDNDDRGNKYFYLHTDYFYYLLLLVIMNVYVVQHCKTQIKRKFWKFSV